MWTLWRDRDSYARLRSSRVAPQVGKSASYLADSRWPEGYACPRCEHLQAYLNEFTFRSQRPAHSHGGLPHRPMGLGTFEGPPTSAFLNIPKPQRLREYTEQTAQAQVLALKKSSGSRSRLKACQLARH